MRIKSIFIIAALAFLATLPSFGEEGPREKSKKLNLTLSDSVFLALRKNRTIESAYLDRISQKYNLAVAEDEFNPDLFITPSGSYNSSESTGRSATGTLGTSFKVRQKVKTGGSFDFVWDNSVARTKTKRAADSSYADSWALTFTQPLLKGGGIDVATASQTIARINEEQYALSLKSTIMRTVTSVITTYRSYLQTFRQLKITEDSLERAKRNLEVNQALIDAGRMAKLEIVQTQADIASREFNLISAQNGLDSARLSLIQILDIDKQTMIDLVEEAEVKPMHPNLEECIQISLNNRPDYLQTLLSLKTSEISLEVAKNSRLWNLDLNAGIGQSGSNPKFGPAEKPLGDIGRSDWNAGLNLTIPFGDVERHKAYVSSEIGLRNQKIALQELKENVELEISDRVRDVEMKLKQLDLARLARDLSRQKLEIENEKLKTGRTTNFQVVSYESDLVSAENNELVAIINYQNALTNLDLALGTTLKTWKIEVKDEKESASNILKKLEPEK
jgi:outer membrane protein TolC